MSEQLTELKVSFAIRHWAEDRKPERPVVPWPDRHAILDGLLRPTTQRGFRPTTELDEAVGFQAWVDIPLQWKEGVRDANVLRAIDDVLDWLKAAIRARHPKVAAAVEAELTNWREWVKTAPKPTTAVTEAGVDQPSFDDDAFVMLVDPWRAAIAWARLPRGEPGCPGAMLRVAVGPDRFGVRVKGRETERVSSQVPIPYDPMRFSLWSSLRALDRSVQTLHGMVVRYVKQVHSALGDPDSGKVTELLETNGKLLACRLALEHRGEALQRVFDRAASRALSGAFAVDESDAKRLRRLAEGLRHDREEITEAPQFLVAASSLRVAREAKLQADHTLFLTRWAAALILPTLVAGALGANVLPWSRSEPAALIGMLAMMLGSGVAAYFLVALQNVPKAMARAYKLAVTAGGLIALAGLLLLLHGTST